MQTSETCAVSIITPCYNSRVCISETIDSVLAQTYGDWEMIIVDDCSTDDSAGIIKEYAAKDPRIRYLKTAVASGSPTIPRNMGIDNAKGKYIAFLDADDKWLPDKLERQLCFMEDTQCDFVYSDYEKIKSDGERGNRVVRMPRKATFWDVIETCVIPCLTVMIKKEAIGNTRFRSVAKEDFVFWLDILKKGVIAYNVGSVLALYREQPQSRSSNKWVMIKEQWDILRNVEGVKPAVATYFMTKFLFYGFLKYLK